MSFPIGTNEFDRIGIHPEIKPLGLREQLIAHNIQMPNNLCDALKEKNPKHEFFDCTKDDEYGVVWLIRRFLYEASDEKAMLYSKFIEEDPDNRPDIEDLLIFTTNILLKASGEHDDLAGFFMTKEERHLMNFLNLDIPPKTACRFFNPAFKKVFEIAALRYNPDILDHFKLVLTDARLSTDLSVPLTRSKQTSLYIPHIFLTLVSYDGKEIMTTPIDPYHINRQPVNHSNIDMLDFSRNRSMDAVEEIWTSLDNKTTRHESTSTSDLYRLEKTDWHDLPDEISRLNYGLLIAEMVGFLREGNIEEIRKLTQSAEPFRNLLTRGILNPDPQILQEEDRQILRTLRRLGGNLRKRQKESEIFTIVINDILENFLYEVQVENIKPEELVALVKLVDYSGANKIKLDINVWQKLLNLMTDILENENILERLESLVGESSIFQNRTRFDRLFIPEYEDPNQQEFWIVYKVNYFLTLVKLGIEAWINSLPRYPDLEEILSLKQPNKGNLKKYVNTYLNFINKLTGILEENGYPELVEQIEERVTS